MKFVNIAIIAILTAAPLPLALATGAETGATQPMTTAAPGDGWVARATITTGVEDREPIDSITTLSNDTSKIYYFTEIRDMAGETVTHRWEYNGAVMAEVSFYVGGARWRVYSSKTLQAIWLGDWKVSVVDSSGNPLSATAFVYTASDTAQSGISMGAHDSL